jgi:hypothetical protein
VRGSAISSQSRCYAVFITTCGCGLGARAKTENIAMAGTIRCARIHGQRLFSLLAANNRMCPQRLPPWKSHGDSRRRLQNKPQTISNAPSTPDASAPAVRCARNPQRIRTRATSPAATDTRMKANRDPAPALSQANCRAIHAAHDTARGMS